MCIERGSEYIASDHFRQLTKMVRAGFGDDFVQLFLVQKFCFYRTFYATLWITIYGYE